MTFYTIIEIIGSLISMAGAWYAISIDTNQNPKAKGIGFILFSISNLFMILFAIHSQLYALLVQMLVFNVGSLSGLIKFSKKEFKFPILFIAFWVWSYAIYVVLNMNNLFIFEIPILEQIAAIIAIIGSYALLSNSFLLKNIALLGFFLADVLYVYIGIINNHLFFTIMSAFFIFTSLKGFYSLNLQRNRVVI